MNNNVETIKKMYEAFGKGDVPAILANLTEDAVWSFEANDKLSWSGIRRGVEARGFFEGLVKDLDDMRLDMTEFVSDADTVAVFGRFQGTSRTSGKRVDTPVAHYFRFRGNKVAEYRNFTNSAAFADAMAA